MLAECLLCIVWFRAGLILASPTRFRLMLFCCGVFCLFVCFVFKGPKMSNLQSQGSLCKESGNFKALSFRLLSSPLLSSPLLLSASKRTSLFLSAHPSLHLHLPIANALWWLRQWEDLWACRNHWELKRLVSGIHGDKDQRASSWNHKTAVWGSGSQGRATTRSPFPPITADAWQESSN